MSSLTELKSIGIFSWPEEERPREKLLSLGPHSLTDAQLIAILLRIGIKGKDAVECGRELIECFGSLHAMMSAPLSAWDGIKGIGDAKKAQLIATFELGRRAALPVDRKKIDFRATHHAADYFAARLRGLPEEHFRVAFLNRKGRLLEDVLLAEGTVDSVHPPVRSIVARALRTNASALIAAHNHPSGAAEPSEPDKILTRDLIAACHSMGIKILDHIIVGEAAYFSFADTGLLDELCMDTLAPIPGTR
jgi:DNA repair protein RadC